MIQAIIVGLLAVLLAFLYDKRIISWALFGAILLPTLLSAFRLDWGNDMPSYARFFDEYANSGVSIFQIDQLSYVRGDNRSSEPLWTAINILCKPIGFMGMVIALAFFEGGIVYWFIRKYVNRGYTWLAVFIYTMNPDLMVLGCSMMRQWLAMCIVLLSVPYYIKGKFIPYAVSIFIASLVHTSAIVFIPIFFIRYFQNKKVNFLILALVVLSWTLLGRLFVGNIGYVGMGISDAYGIGTGAIEGKAASVGFGAFCNVLLVLMCFFSLPKANEDTKYITWFFLGYALFMPFVAVFPLANRVLYYFEAISIAALPNGIKNTTNLYIKYGMLVWIVFWNSYMFYSFFFSKTWFYSYFIYHSIFEASFWY